MTSYRATEAEIYTGFPHFLMGENWCARCPTCREALTKFCFTDVEAQREGDDAMRHHRCTRARVQRAPRQQVL